jgi:hypothetical protein
MSQSSPQPRRYTTHRSLGAVLFPGQRRPDDTAGRNHQNNCVNLYPFSFTTWPSTLNRIHTTVSSMFLCTVALQRGCGGSPISHCHNVIPGDLILAKIFGGQFFFQARHLDLPASCFGTLFRHPLASPFKICSLLEGSRESRMRNSIVGIPILLRCPRLQ